MTFKPHVLSQFGVGNNFEFFTKQVCIFIDGLWPDREEYLNSQFRVLLNCEPSTVSGGVCPVKEIIKNSNKFDLILTSHQEVLDNCSNSILFPFGTSWVSDDFLKKETNFEISFLCGNKKFMEGHMLRHSIFNNLKNIKNLPVKSFYSGLQTKDIVFDTSQFTIVTENSCIKNYFTEKIVDCFITKTIPIYWGCPNIGDFFDKRGIITFNSENELFKKISLLTADIYQQKESIIEKNYNESLKYKNLFTRVSKEIQQRL